nr:unnamed protein product [Callosobruchus analis]
MPRSYCVPRCNSNYKKGFKEGKSYVSSFAFPKDEQLRRKWIAAIHREVSFVPTSNTVVCSKHFLEYEIITVDTITRPDGSILTCPRKIPKLQPTAIPTIFPNQPSYMTVKFPHKRKDPEQRTQELLDRDTKNFDNEDIIALYPVKKNSSEMLKKMTLDIIIISTDVGYIIVSLICDNHRMNRGMYELLFFSHLESDLSLDPTNIDNKHSIRNPFSTNQKIFMLFDTNIGNLKHIHGKECHSTVKLAPALSQKVLHLSSLERQNVSLAVQFLKIILSWWKIVNVRSSKAGIHLKDPLREPITSPDHDSIKFLRKFIQFLNA